MKKEEIKLDKDLIQVIKNTDLFRQSNYVGRDTGEYSKDGLSGLERLVIDIQNYYKTKQPMTKLKQQSKVKATDFDGSQEVEVKEQIWFKDNGEFQSIYDKRIIGYKTADGKWHKL